TRYFADRRQPRKRGMTSRRKVRKGSPSDRRVSIDGNASFIILAFLVDDVYYVDMTPPPIDAELEKRRSRPERRMCTRAYRCIVLHSIVTFLDHCLHNGTCSVVWTGDDINDYVMRCKYVIDESRRLTSILDVTMVDRVQDVKITIQ